MFIRHSEKGWCGMKNGIHRNRKIDEISAYRILREMYKHRKENEDGKVHIHEIKDGHISKTTEIY